MKDRETTATIGRQSQRLRITEAKVFRCREREKEREKERELECKKQRVIHKHKPRSSVAVPNIKRQSQRLSFKKA